MGTNVVIPKFLKRITLCVILFFSFVTYGQKSKEIYGNFEGFKKLGFFVSLDYNRKTIVEDFQREYSLSANNSTSFTLGFDYVFKPMNEFSFRTGLYLRSVPLYNFNITILPENIPVEDNFGIIDEQFKNNPRYIFSVPIFYEMKKQLDNKLFFSMIGGLNISIMQDGAIGLGINTFTGSQGDDVFEIFSSYGLNNQFYFYPDLVLRPGFYFTNKKLIIHTSFIYNKSIVSYFKGEYQFGNLINAEPVRGDLRLTGDYIGLGVTVFFKKKKNKRKDSEY